MRVSWKRVAGFVLVAAIALGMSLPSLHAAAVAVGKFKLPFDANLEKIALPNGDYTFTVDHMAMNSIVTVYQGTTIMALLRPQSFSSYETRGEKPVLIFVRHDGNTALRALRFPGSGTFYFPLPKDLKILSAKQPQLLETISVEVSGD
jgi:hypothetical protein